jgi:6-pyruvoyltetrahydropterin/6-carboxytetrahydropterin synthase
MSHRITLERNTLRFAAAHFTVSASECEPLHGHNYDVFVELEGDLTPDSWVIDFGEAKRIVRDLCRELDHRFLMPLRCPALTIERSDGEVTITGDGFRYVMPEKDVAFLEIDNSTAERLAEWFAGRLTSALRERDRENITRIAVGVEEMPGQAGWFELTPGT